MATLAKQMELSLPVSLSQLIDYLSAPTAVQFNSAGLPETQGITASATWTINAQGFWNFTGSLNNSDKITQQWAIGMALPVQGARFWTYAHGQVGPDLPLFSNNASWNYTGFDQKIIDFWPEIFGARSTKAATNLQVSINVGDVLEAIAIFGGGGAILAVGALLGPNGKGWHCDPPSVEPAGGPGGAGADVKMRCYPNE
jgi:hypothetical protein